MSVKTEIPGVNNAVQKLEELADRMQSDKFGFRSSDLENIDMVIEALHDLEAERKQMHMLLETETIKSSVLRHQLKLLPGQIRDEIKEAVLAARQLNANVLWELQQRLENMNNSIAALDEKAQELEKENAVLYPERELLKQQHEEIISQLNQGMADKAEMQISLNETRDNVRQTNQDIVDLEDGILQLKEDLIQERTQARQEKKKLKEAVADTDQKTREQKAQNVIKKKELDVAQEQLLESKGKIDVFNKNIEQSEKSRARLEEEERTLILQISDQLKKNDQIRIKGVQILNERIQEERDFEKKQKELIRKIKKSEADLDAEDKRTVALEKQKDELLAGLQERETTKREDKKRISELDERLQIVKAALNSKSEEIGRLQTETVDMESQTVALIESHQAVLAQLKKQIEECRDLLSKERKERMEAQVQKDAVSKTLDDLKMETQTFMTEMSGSIQDGKRRHVELSNEGMQLQKDLKENETQISALSADLEMAQNKYQEMFSKMKTYVDALKIINYQRAAFKERQRTRNHAVLREEVQFLENAKREKSKHLEEQTPIFNDLEEHFEKRTQDFEKMKKDVVVMKNQRQSLEDAVRKAKREKDGLKIPQESLRLELKEKRQELMKQLKEHGASTQEMETQIFAAGCKLRTLMEENDKIESSCMRLEKELADLQVKMKELEQMKIGLEAELAEQKNDLIKKWDTDAMMQKFFATRDEAIAEAFSKLLTHTSEREHKIDQVTTRLNEELQELSQFLDSIASRRPPGTGRQVRSTVTSQQSRRSRSRSKSNEREISSRGSQRRSHSREQSRSQSQSLQHKGITFDDKENA
ncbi:coiled-coil domain-containing protein 175-like isoform X1 [Pomacea canaliculata]|uniref:coiled-coil domain-containing protein 175-like isoform X1 n=1 Tax=Pomacea canaliculata TaxID=400727 RepID=UPI000D738B17|nr:coiled-coil domain-containing protein 175-like isoform X1 [Pomacea canaliculata]